VSPQFEEYALWNYHHLAETGWRAAPGHSFLLRTRVRFAHEGEQTLRFCFYKRGRAWLNGHQVLEVENGGGWGDPPLFRPQDVSVQPQSGWNELAIEVEYQDIDWEVWFGSTAPLEVDDCQVTEQPFHEASTCAEFSPENARGTHLRPYFIAALSQQTVGLSAYFGMLEEDEAKYFLRAALPESTTATTASAPRRSSRTRRRMSRSCATTCWRPTCRAASIIWRTRWQSTECKTRPKLIYAWCMAACWSAAPPRGGKNGAPTPACAMPGVRSSSTSTTHKQKP
jgi:hypothetical protein